MKNSSPLRRLVKLPDNKAYFHKDYLSRVLKMHHNYICGMCGTQFNSLNSAWQCVANDTLKLSSFPVIQMNHHEECFIHCLLCGKNYVNAEDTALCLAHDLDHTDLPLNLMNHLNTMIINALRGQKFTKRDLLNSRHTVKHSPKLAEKALVKEEESIPIQPTPPEPAVEPQILKMNVQTKAEAPPIKAKSPPINIDKQHDLLVINEQGIDTMSDISEAPKLESPAKEEELISITDTAAPAMAVHEEPPPPVEPPSYVLDPKDSKKLLLPRKPNQKPYGRDNAYYTCSVCKQRFFTKLEAETHFYEHPLVDSV